MIEHVIMSEGDEAFIVAVGVVTICLISNLAHLLAHLYNI